MQTLMEKAWSFFPESLSSHLAAGHKQNFLQVFPLGLAWMHSLVTDFMERCLPGGNSLQNHLLRSRGKQLATECLGQCAFGRCLMLKRLWVLKLLGIEEARCALEELGWQLHFYRSLQSQSPGTRKQKHYCFWQCLPLAPYCQNLAWYQLAKEKVLKGPYLFSQSRQKGWI